MPLTVVGLRRSPMPISYEHAGTLGPGQVGGPAGRAELRRARRRVTESGADPGPHRTHAERDFGARIAVAIERQDGRAQHLTLDRAARTERPAAGPGAEPIPPRPPSPPWRR